MTELEKSLIGFAEAVTAERKASQEVHEQFAELSRTAFSVMPPAQARAWLRQYLASLGLPESKFLAEDIQGLRTRAITISMKRSTK